MSTAKHEPQGGILTEPAPKSGVKYSAHSSLHLQQVQLYITLVLHYSLKAKSIQQLQMDFAQTSFK